MKLLEQEGVPRPELSHDRIALPLLAIALQARLTPALDTAKFWKQTTSKYIASLPCPSPQKTTYSYSYKHLSKCLMPGLLSTEKSLEAFKLEKTDKILACMLTYKLISLFLHQVNLTANGLNPADSNNEEKMKIKHFPNDRSIWLYYFNQSQYLPSVCFKHFWLVSAALLI